MTSTQGLLQNRPILIGISLVCSYESVVLWLTITKYSIHPHDPVGIVGLAFAAFIAAAITYRSPFFADRVVFGALALISALTAVRMAHLTSLAMLTVKAAEALLCTIAATVSLVVLLRGLKTLDRSN